MAAAKGHPSKRKKKRRMLAESPHPRLHNHAIEALVYGLLILLLGMWQQAPHGWPTIVGGRPLLLVPLVAAIAMFTGPVGGAAAGVGAGLLWDLYSTRLFGFNALVLLAIGCAVGLLVRLLLRNNPLSALLLTSGSVVAQTIVSWLCTDLLPGKDGVLLLLWRTVLPNTVYTLVLCLPVYLLVRGVTKALKKRE